VVLSGLEKASAIKFDAKGNMLVFDAGKDLQFKIFSPENKLIRTIGTTGGA